MAVSQSAVAKYMVRRRQPPSQTGRTFLANHVEQIMTADFLVVPTVTGPPPVRPGDLGLTSGVASFTWR